MKNSRLQKFEKPVEFDPSPEQVAQAREAAVNMIMNVFDRMPKDNIKPPVESFSELARQAKEGVSRQPTIIDSGASEKPVQSSAHPTKIIMGDAENLPKIVTSFNSEELELLRKIQNGEQ
jgi:hypothetical protein